MLCRGVDFGVPPRISEPEVLAEFELLRRQVNSFPPISLEAADRSRCEVAAVARRYATAKPDFRSFSLQREHRKVLKELRKDKSLIITRPDKGRATVILTRDAYVEKMMSILEDKSKFLRLGPVEQFDRTLSIENALRTYLKRLVSEKEMSAHTYNEILPVGSSRPRMYGLPKVHKPGVPLRPILSMSGSPQYMISKWLCDRLRPVVQHYGKHCVEDSFVFSDSVKSAKLSQDGFMCSLDVVSLFTNVPLKEVIDICADAIYRNDSIETELTMLSEKSFKELMEMVTSGVEFSFDDIMYRQVDGVAMGSPLGPTLANIFVGFYESKIPDSEWPELYWRFVDDVFSHFDSKETSEKFCRRMNALHPSLCFTCEDEQEGQLPFLDVKVIRTSKGIVTTIYRKPTFTGLYTPWDSYSPTKYKINLVRSLTHRVRRICSPIMVETELNTLREILLRNGYPGHVLEKYMLTCQDREKFIGPKCCPVIIHLPWIGKQSEVLERKVNDAVRIARFALKACVVYSKSRAFSLPKDVLPTHSFSNIVYLYECRQCECRYVGKTTQHLSERIKQHVPKHLLDSVRTSTIPQVRKRGRPPKKRNNPGEDYQSAIACHLAANELCCRQYSDSDFRILAHARSQQHLNVLESVFIYQLKPSLCKQKLSVMKLNLFAHNPA